MKGLLTFIAGAVAVLGLYALPVLMELTLIHGDTSPWFSCVVLGDFLGCAVLFLLGMRRLGVWIYLASTAAEAFLLALKVLSPERLIWVTNLVPALVVAALLVKSTLENVMPEKN